MNDCVSAQVDSHVERQPLFSEPRRVQDRYAAGEDSGEDAGKVLICAANVLMFAQRCWNVACSPLPCVLLVRVLRCSTATQSPASHAQAFVSLNWVLSEEPLDLETELALDFLDYLLVWTWLLPLSGCCSIAVQNLEQTVFKRSRSCVINTTAASQ